MCLLLFVFIRFNGFTRARISPGVVCNELPAGWEPSGYTFIFCETAFRVSNSESRSSNNYVGYNQISICTIIHWQLKPKCIVIFSQKSTLIVDLIVSIFVIQSIRKVWKQWEFYLLFTLYALYVYTLRIFSAALPCLYGFCSTYWDRQ
jgi:hypothetical protein